MLICGSWANIQKIYLMSKLKGLKNVKHLF